MTKIFLIKERDIFMDTNVMDNENIRLEDVDEIDALAKYIPHKLTPFQIKVLDNQLYSVKSTMWNQSVLYRFDNSEVDVKRLKRAVNKTFRNHPALSTRLYLDYDGEFMQQYAPGFVDRVDIEIVTEAEFEEISKELIRPFKMVNAPLMRCRLFKTPEHVYLFVDVHHIVVDATSGTIVVRDIMSCYADENAELPKDYYYTNLWLDYKNSKLPEYAEAKEYFKSKYDGVKWCNIPEPDIDTRENKANCYELYLDINTDEVKKAERRCRTTRARIANAAGLLTLHKFSQKDDVLITWIFNGRTNTVRREAVGLLIKELPIAVHVGELETLEDLYKEINQQMKKTTSHADYDYMLFKEAAFSNDSIEVNYLSTLDFATKGEKAIDFAGCKAHLMELPRVWDMAEARFEMDIHEIPAENGGVAELKLSIQYMASIYKPETIEKFSLLYRDMFKKLINAEKTDLISSILID